MATRPKLTPVQVLQRLQRRVEKRMECLQRVKLAGFEPVIAELETELDYCAGRRGTWKTESPIPAMYTGDRSWRRQSLQPTTA